VGAGLDAKSAIAVECSSECAGGRHNMSEHSSMQSYLEDASMHDAASALLILRDGDVRPLSSACGGTNAASKIFSRACEPACHRSEETVSQQASDVRHRGTSTGELAPVTTRASTLMLACDGVRVEVPGINPRPADDTSGPGTITRCCLKPPAPRIGACLCAVPC
jgi:hypothetical protein